MLRHRVWAIPASQQHDRDPFKRFGNRGVVLEIAMYYLDTCKVGLWTNNAPSSSASTYLKIASTFISDRQARHSVFHERARGWTTWSSASRDCPSPLLYWRRLAASKPLLRRPWPALGCRSVSLTRARSETSPARWAAWPRPTRSTRR